MIDIGYPRQISSESNHAVYVWHIWEEIRKPLKDKWPLTFLWVDKKADIGQEHKQNVRIQHQLEMESETTRRPRKP